MLIGIWQQLKAWDIIKNVRRHTSYAGEDTGRSEEYWQEYRAWRNDGKPTGIESDEQFYELQRQAYGEILVDLDQ